MAYKNYRYNRLEYVDRHEYLVDYEGIRTFSKICHEGYIKCKLFHGDFGSLVVPDQIFIEKHCLGWIQPLYFGPNILVKTDDLIESTLFIDISFGVCLEVKFTSKGYLRSYPDGAEMFKCTILGPENVVDYFTGLARWRNNYLPEIKLFHHTKEVTVHRGMQSVCNIW